MNAPLKLRYVAGSHVRGHWQAFYDNLIKLCAGHRSAMGLAVSGGVDSMALAHLCREVQQNQESQTKRIKFNAFICDHRLRDGSTAEAERVAGWLEDRLGLNATILTLPRYEDTSEEDGRSLTVEQWARRQRYRAIGRACSERSIEHVLLGHHADDNYETALLRLSQGRQLRGIEPITNIPECHGIYGVGESGRVEAAPRGSERVHYIDQSHDVSGSRKECQRQARCGTIHRERGGVKLVRPLLDTSKQRLVEICRGNDIPWVEDPTNADKTYTYRNTIRHLAKAGSLPKALQPESLSTVLESSRERREKLKAIARKIVASWPKTFDTRTGTIRIQPLSYSVNTSQLNVDGCGEHRQLVAGYVLKYLLSVVSPEKEIHISKCVERAATWEPFLDPENKKFGIDNFTLVGVHLMRNEKTTQYPYVLTRQPYKPTDVFNFVIQIPARTLDSPEWSPWHLWDNRFWIRIHNPSHTSPLYIRPWSDPLQDGKNELYAPFMHKWPSTNPQRSIKTYVKAIAGRGMTATLPAIAAEPLWLSEVAEAAESAAAPQVDAEAKPDKLPGQVLAVPSIGLVAANARERGLRWEIRYRNIDLPPQPGKPPRDIFSLSAPGDRSSKADNYRKRKSNPEKKITVERKPRLTIKDLWQPVSARKKEDNSHDALESEMSKDEPVIAQNRGVPQEIRKPAIAEQVQDNGDALWEDSKALKRLRNRNFG